MFSSTQKLPTKRMTTTSTTILLAVVTAIVLVDYAASADMADSSDASKLAFAGTQSVLPNSVAIQHDEKRSLRSDDTATAEAAEERVSLHVPLDAPLQGKANEYLAFGYYLGKVFQWTKDFLHANPTEKFRHTIPTEQSDMLIIEHILDKFHQKVSDSKPGPLTIPLDDVVEKTFITQHAGSSPAGQDAQAKLKIEELKYTLFQDWHANRVDPLTLLKTSSGWKGKYKELLTSFASDYQKFIEEHESKSGVVAEKILRKVRAKLSHPENVTPPVETQAKKPVAASSDRTNEYNDKYSRQWSGKLNHEEGGKVQEGWPQRGEREEGKREEGWKHKEREELKEGEPKRGEREEGKLKEGEIHAGEIHEGHLSKGKLKEADELKEGEIHEGHLSKGKLKEADELKEGEIHAGEIHEGHFSKGKLKEADELKEGEPKRGEREEGKLKEGEIHEGHLGKRKHKEADELKEGEPKRGKREKWKREGGGKLKEGEPERGDERQKRLDLQNLIEESERDIQILHELERQNLDQLKREREIREKQKREPGTQELELLKQKRKLEQQIYNHLEQIHKLQNA